MTVGSNPAFLAVQSFLLMPDCGTADADAHCIGFGSFCLWQFSGGTSESRKFAGAQNLFKLLTLRSTGETALSRTRRCRFNEHLLQFREREIYSAGRSRTTTCSLYKFRAPAFLT